MNPSNFTAYYQYSPHIQWRCRWRGGKILTGTVARAKVGELEEEAREVFKGG